MDCKFCKRDLADGIKLGGGIIKCRGCQKENLVLEVQEQKEELTVPETEYQRIRPKGRRR